jgi:membrane protein YqaA with SNARE-associated domain
MSVATKETPIQRLTRKLGQYSDRAWYLPFNGFLAGVDLFIGVVPVDALVVSAVLLRPKRWISPALWVALGSAAGTAAMAALATHYGPPFVEGLAGGFMQSTTWREVDQAIDKHGAWALVIGSLSPIPIASFALIGGLANQPWQEVFGAALGGRTIRYLAIALATQHAPALIKRFAGPRKKGR